MAGQQSIIIWLNAVLIALTFAAIGSRVGRRVFLVGIWSWHDVLITVAAVSATVFSVLQIVGTKYGLGTHQDQISSSNLTSLIKLIVASNVFYFACNWAVKHALLLFYSELVRDNRFYNISIYIMHFVAFGFGLSSILVDLFQCRPIHKAWDGKVEGWCANMDIFFYCNASIMLATDLVLYLMPVVFTWHLQLRRPQRIGLNCLFALGGLVLAASAVRVQAVDKYATEHQDQIWWFANAMIWSVLENHLAIVAACAPSVKVIVQLLFPHLASSYRKVLSRVSPSSSSRSRSRASRPFDLVADLESGTRKSGRSEQSGKLKLTPLTTPLPSPAYTATSGSSRASKNFAKWFRSPTSPRALTSLDSLEESGLVYVEDVSQKREEVQLSQITRDGRQSQLGMVGRDNDIQVETTIRVESESDSGSGDEEREYGRAV